MTFILGRLLSYKRCDVQLIDKYTNYHFVFIYLKNLITPQKLQFCYLLEIFHETPMLSNQNKKKRTIRRMFIQSLDTIEATSDGI